MTSDKIVAISKIVEIRNCKDQLGFQIAKHGILQMFDLALDSRPAAPRARGSPVVVPWARAVAGLSLQLALQSLSCGLWDAACMGWHGMHIIYNYPRN
jgi:hypothetical protein